MADGENHCEIVETASIGHSCRSPYRYPGAWARPHSVAAALEIVRTGLCRSLKSYGIQTLADMEDVGDCEAQRPDPHPSEEDVRPA